MKEYERKYLVNVHASLLTELLPNVDAKHRIVQGYLSTDPERVIRLRRVHNGVNELTIKGLKIEGECIEINIPVMPVQADALVNLCTSTIRKTRFDVMWKGMKFEVDVFEGELEGLVMVELEGRREDIIDFIDNVGLPHWVGLDVTDDKFFSNASLSTKTWATCQRYISELLNYERRHP